MRRGGVPTVISEMGSPWRLVVCVSGCTMSTAWSARRVSSMEYVGSSRGVDRGNNGGSLDEALSPGYSLSRALPRAVQPQCQHLPNPGHREVARERSEQTSPSLLAEEKPAAKNISVRATGSAGRVARAGGQALASGKAGRPWRVGRAGGQAGASGRAGRRCTQS